MRKKCSVCRHEEREAIDAALRAGVLSVESIARAVDRSRASMRRHQYLCLGLSEQPSLAPVREPPPPRVRRWSSVRRARSAAQEARRRTELGLLVFVVVENARLRAQLLPQDGHGADTTPDVPGDTSKDIVYQDKKYIIEKGQRGERGGEMGPIEAPPTPLPPPTPTPPSPPAVRTPAPKPAPASTIWGNEEEQRAYYRLLADIQAMRRR